MIRAVRVGLLGGGSLLLATAAHLSGGGTLPGPGLLAVAAFLLGLGAVLLTRRRVRLPLLLAVLVPQQVLLHVLFDAAAAAGGCTPVQAAHHAMTMLTCAPGGGMGPMGYAWPMLAGHLVATLGTAWLLARGEAWCCRLVDRVAHAAYAAPAARPRRRRPRPVTVVPTVALLARPHRPRVSRGPPLSFA
ncbi:MAG TPA: hypothetical protein VGC37_13245 [Friedmanniella sp.]